MQITLSYSETRDSTITLTRLEVEALLTEHGQAPSSTYAESTDTEILAALRTELATPHSNLPAALEPQVDEMADITHRQWDAAAQ
ncbi:hypothetical protein GS896_27665 [Rhodococcus hoagii]|nr:hypothetical protein [Prescottella equi]MBM4654031.1 hypothetical protein [Prescottella equi]MBM4719706.1 hypothetical protein [Prescottella equi]NKR23503.1 hypothetical protein [Prescottella equi]NKT56343.1 hypothetical protein [Prescottella equi]